MITITIFFIAIISLIISIMNVIAHCIVAIIQGTFEGFTNVLTEKLTKK